MSETTRVERKRRQYADLYMATHPGVPRQEAKRRVSTRARLAVAAEDIAKVGQKLREIGSRYSGAA